MTQAPWDRRWRQDCRFFNGYRPCAFSRPCEDCPEFRTFEKDILIINLDALGDVLRTTALLPAIRRQHPHARITWLTRPRALPLLMNNPLIDEILGLDLESLIALDARLFDLLLCTDKSRVSGGLAARFRATEKRGFGVDLRGVIVPLNPQAEYLYATGLDDELKFRQNTLSMPEMLARALGLDYARDPYRLYLDDHERAAGPPRKVGFNTGSSLTYPLKHLPLELQERTIRLVAESIQEPVLLLGGPEDRERNQELAQRLGSLIETSPTDGGLRAGAAQIARCEVVFSGDSLGLHLAIALGCHVVAWFGPTCPQEIELFERGIWLLSDVACAPCWRRSCERSPLCRERVDPAAARDAILTVLDARREGRPIAERRGRAWAPVGAER